MSSKQNELKEGAPWMEVTPTKHRLSGSNPDAPTSEDTCPCPVCEVSDHPCMGDCDPGEECAGCIELREESEDVGFAIDIAVGRL